MILIQPFAKSAVDLIVLLFYFRMGS